MLHCFWQKTKTSPKTAAYPPSAREAALTPTPQALRRATLTVNMLVASRLSELTLQTQRCPHTRHYSEGLVSVSRTNTQAHPHVEVARTLEDSQSLTKRPLHTRGRAVDSSKVSQLCHPQGTIEQRENQTRVKKSHHAVSFTTSCRLQEHWRNPVRHATATSLKLDPCAHGCDICLTPVRRARSNATTSIT